MDRISIPSACNPLCVVQWYIPEYTPAMFIQKVIQALTEHRVKYALVGGYAVALHGAVRGTHDVDIVIQLTQANFNKAEQALTSIGLRPRLPVTAADVFTYREEYIRNRNLIAWSFVNHDRPIEIVDIVLTEDAAKLKTVMKSALGLKIRVASIDAIIAMKRKSKRPQDIEDIRALEKLR